MAETQFAHTFHQGNLNMTATGASNLRDHMTVQSALDIARNSDYEVDQAIWDYLESSVDQLWRRISDQPDSYVMDKDEFSLFNFFIYRYKDSQSTEKAVARFWHHHRGNHTPPPQDSFVSFQKDLSSSLTLLQ